MKITKWVACGAMLAAATSFAGGTKSADSMKKTEAPMQGSGGSGFEDKASASTKKAIEQRTRDYEKAFNEHDFKKLGSFYSKDSTLLGAKGEQATGRQQIQSQIESDHQGDMKDSQISLEVLSVREVAPNLAVVDLTQKVMNPKAEEPATVHVTALAKKQGNEWMIEALRASAAPREVGVGGSGSSEQPLYEQDSQIQQPSESMPEQQPGTQQHR